MLVLGQDSLTATEMDQRTLDSQLTAEALDSKPVEYKQPSWHAKECPQPTSGCVHVSIRECPGLVQDIYSAVTQQFECAVAREEAEDGGACSLAVRLKLERPELKVGLMVAANSGRPGGSCGVRGGVRAVHPRHSTQEEDVVSSWLIATAGTIKSCLLYTSPSPRDS
eukprot:TRINITY_DN10422_c0_g1_i1.p2 TRINITY_DN10422_c0_g1~~TRINITY_DN10422_c0_g1_i1.p2  ORF type:complete len:167 (+),score=34.18 TRINITY_DN10422_c0_g1_i1:417-917(+)